MKIPEIDVNMITPSDEYIRHRQNNGLYHVPFKDGDCDNLRRIKYVLNNVNMNRERLMHTIGLDYVISIENNNYISDDCFNTIISSLRRSH